MSDNPYLAEVYLDGMEYATCRYCNKPIRRGYSDGWVAGGPYGSHGCSVRGFVVPGAAYFMPHEP